MDGPSRSRATRRGFVGLLGAVALAGCSGTDGEGSASDATLTAAPLPESTSTPRDRRVIGPDLIGGRAYAEPWYERTSTTTLSPPGLTVAFHPRPTGLPNLVGGGGFGQRGTAKAPARLLLTLVNTGDRPVSLPHDTVPGQLVTPANGARAFLLPVPGTSDDAGSGDSERDVSEPPWFDGYWRGRRSGNHEGVVTVRPDEVGTLEYHLVAGPDGPALPVGTYAFETGFDWRFTLGVWRTDAPGPEDTSRFADTDVPRLPAGAPVAWFHHADRTTEVYLRPSQERVSLTGDGTTVRLALFNHSTRVLVGNPLTYELLKLAGGTWYHIVPEQLPSPGGNLPTGATLEKRFALRHGAAEGRDDAVPVGHLGGGRYAVRFGMHRPDENRRHAALLDVVAPAVELVPDPGLRVEGRNSTTPVGWLDPGAQLFDAIVNVIRTDERAERTVIAEQVMQDRVLRNTIPLFDEDTEVVELHTQDRIADQTVRPKGTLRLSFRGTTYEVFRRDD